MNDAGYKRWTGTEWWAESYEDLWRETPVASDEVAVAGEEAVTAAQDGAKIAPVSGKKAGRKGGKQANSRGSASKDTVVYLTADSSDELNELKEGETYIIGGICDHNRYKARSLSHCPSIYPKSQRQATPPSSLSMLTFIYRTSA